MHVIDEKSQVAGYDAEQFEEGDARLFLSIEARDHAIGALVHDMRIYTAAEVLFGMHYAEAVTLDDQKRPVADLMRLSLVEPDPSAHLIDILAHSVHCGTLTPLILVRIQVPQPHNLVILLRFVSFRLRRISSDMSAGYAPPSQWSGSRDAKPRHAAREGARCL